MLSQSPMPGSGASITAHRVMRVRILCRQRVPHHVADVMRHEIGVSALSAHPSRRRCRRPGSSSCSPTSAGGGQTHAAQIRHDHRIGCWHEFGRQQRPHVAGIGKTVQQDDRRPLPSNANIKTSVPLVCTSGCGSSAGKARLRACARQSIEKSRQRRHEKPFEHENLPFTSHLTRADYRFAATAAR